MNELLAQLIAERFHYQDSRMPAELVTPGRPFQRMDSPVYRCCIEAICRTRPIRSFLEIGVKQGASLAIVLQHARDLERVVLPRWKLASGWLARAPAGVFNLAFPPQFLKDALAKLVPSFPFH